MAIDVITPNSVKNMFIAGAKYLESKKNYVDELNVFPVPDGDTGTNMTLTILAAAKEVEKADTNNMAAIAKAISSGSLRGARGNSGVILSQLFRGFAKGIADHEEIDAMILANALEQGVQTAYKAVMKPKEGTILTVAKALADKAGEIAQDQDDLVIMIKEVLKYGNEVLEQTPDMLPVLKEAGVVDAGGQGLLYVVQGALMALESGEGFTLTIETDTSTGESKVATVHAEQDIKFGYCTEFIIDTKDHNTLEENEHHANGLKRFLGTIGDSIVSVADEDLIKIHVHTNEPGVALQKALAIGQLMNIKIDNMRIQHAERVIHGVDSILSGDSSPMEKPIDQGPVELKDNGFVAVSVGEGISAIFESLGVDYVVTGGQTMNPSTEDFVKAVENVHAKNVFIFPNNKNIIMAASQVDAIIEDKNIYVVPSTTIPQGITSLISFDASAEGQENLQVMTDAIEDVKTGQVTFAVRDTSVDSKSISEGDILGILDGQISVVDKEVASATMELVDAMIDSMSELVTIYYGHDTTEEEANELVAYIEDKYGDLEVEVHEGGQPLYYYIVSVE